MTPDFTSSERSRTPKFPARNLFETLSIFSTLDYGRIRSACLCGSNLSRSRYESVADNSDAGFFFLSRGRIRIELERADDYRTERNSNARFAAIYQRKVLQ